MYEYRLRVQMSDESLQIDEGLFALFEKAAAEANSRKNAAQKGRSFKILERLDDHHVLVSLRSNDEVTPTRALSALSRSMIALDLEGRLEGHCHRGCVLKAELIEGGKEGVTILSDVQLLQEITEMLFGRTSLNNRDKALAKEAAEAIREEVLRYLNQKSVSGR